MLLLFSRYYYRCCLTCAVIGVKTTTSFVGASFRRLFERGAVNSAGLIRRIGFKGAAVRGRRGGKGETMDIFLMIDYLGRMTERGASTAGGMRGNVMNGDRQAMPGSAHSGNSGDGCSCGGIGAEIMRME